MLDTGFVALEELIYRIGVIMIKVLLILLTDRWAEGRVDGRAHEPTARRAVGQTDERMMGGDRNKKLVLKNKSRHPMIMCCV